MAERLPIFHVFLSLDVDSNLLLSQFQMEILETIYPFLNIQEMAIESLEMIYPRNHVKRQTQIRLGRWNKDDESHPIKSP